MGFRFSLFLLPIVPCFVISSCRSVVESTRNFDQLTHSVSKIDLDGRSESCDPLHPSPVIATLGTRTAHQDHHSLDLEERYTLDARPVALG